MNVYIRHKEWATGRFCGDMGPDELTNFLGMLKIHGVHDGSELHEGETLEVQFVDDAASDEFFAEVMYGESS